MKRLRAGPSKELDALANLLETVVLPGQPPRSRAVGVPGDDEKGCALEQNDFGS